MYTAQKLQISKYNLQYNLRFFIFQILQVIYIFLLYLYISLLFISV